MWYHNTSVRHRRTDTNRAYNSRYYGIPRVVVAGGTFLKYCIILQYNIMWRIVIICVLLLYTRFNFLFCFNVIIYSSFLSPLLSSYDGLRTTDDRGGFIGWCTLKMCLGFFIVFFFFILFVVISSKRGPKQFISLLRRILYYYACVPLPTTWYLVCSSEPVWYFFLLCMYKYITTDGVILLFRVWNCDAHKGVGI